MKPGIYRVHFMGGPSQNFGDGIAVIREGTINGGDPGYIYRGSYQTDGGHIRGKINVNRWNPAVSNPIANLSEYDLIIDGQEPPDWNRFSVEGRLQQHSDIRITINGTRLGDAA